MKIGAIMRLYALNRINNLTEYGHLIKAAAYFYSKKYKNIEKRILGLKLMYSIIK